MSYFGAVSSAVTIAVSSSHSLCREKIVSWLGGVGWADLLTGAGTVTGHRSLFETFVTASLGPI